MTTNPIYIKYPSGDLGAKKRQRDSIDYILLKEGSLDNFKNSGYISPYCYLKRRERENWGLDINDYKE